MWLKPRCTGVTLLTSLWPNGTIKDKNTVLPTDVLDNGNEKHVLHKQIAGANIMCAAPSNLDAADVGTMAPIRNWQYRINTAQVPSYQAHPLEA